MYVYIYIYIYIYIHICCVCVCVCACACACACVCVRACVYACVRACVQTNTILYLFPLLHMLKIFACQYLDSKSITYSNCIGCFSKIGLQVKKKNLMQMFIEPNW